MNIDEILNNAEVIQKEMHNFLEEARKATKEANGRKFHYDSMKDVFFILKIAELQQELNTLKTNEKI